MPVNRPRFLDNNAKYKEMGSEKTFGKLNQTPVNEKQKQKNPHLLLCTCKHACMYTHTCVYEREHAHTYIRKRPKASAHTHAQTHTEISSDGGGKYSQNVANCKGATWLKNVPHKDNIGKGWESRREDNSMVPGEEKDEEIKTFIM